MAAFCGGYTVIYVQLCEGETSSWNNKYSLVHTLHTNWHLYFTPNSMFGIHFDKLIILSKKPILHINKKTCIISFAVNQTCMDSHIFHSHVLHMDPLQCSGMTNEEIL